MGLFSRKPFSRASADTVPSGDEPGASTTQYDDGKGTIGLGDRLGDGAPDTNQGKAEPMPATPGHADPAGTGPHTDPPGVPELGDMSAGRALAQVASPTVLQTPHTSVLPAAAVAGPGSGTPGGTARRAPGSQGETPDGEDIESDTAAGAARMAPGGGPDQTPRGGDDPGDSQGVNVPHTDAMPGTSEEQGIVHGVRDATS